jgi:Tfp pilus assembly protein PilW
MQVAGVTGSPDSVVNVTAATLAVIPNTHAGKTITLNRAAGITCTLPAATGSGDEYEFITGTTVTSNANIVKVANATDTMVGSATLAQDAADTVVHFDAVSGTSDTISLNGSTTGGIIGARITARDIKLNGTTAIWLVEVASTATGTEATPFSATV